MILETLFFSRSSLKRFPYSDTEAPYIVSGTMYKSRSSSGQMREASIILSIVLQSPFQLQTFSNIWNQRFRQFTSLDDLW